MSKPETSIVENCPKCGVVKWTGATCSHGKVPDPKPDSPKGNAGPVPSVPVKKKR